MAGKSLARQNLSSDSEIGINKQINIVLSASNSLLSMAIHFDRDDVALPGISVLLNKMSDIKREDAKMVNW